MSKRHETYETTHPWVCYTYLHDDAEADRLGYTEIEMECCVCGEKRMVRFKLPTTAELDAMNLAPGHKHAERVQFLTDHNHRPLPHALTWAKPLRNVAAHSETMDVLQTVARRATEEAKDE